MMTLARIAISCALLGLLLWIVDLNALRNAVAEVPLVIILGATLAIASTLFPFAWRWQILSRANGVDLKFADALLATTNSYFFNQVLVSTVGGDAYRVLYLTRRQNKLGAALSSVLADRLVGLFGLLVLVIIGQPILAWASDSQTVRTMAIVVGFAILVSLVILRLMPLHLLRGRSRLSEPLLNALELLRSPTQQQALTHGLLLAIVGQLLLCTSVWLLAQGLGLDISWWLVLFGFPPAYFISLIPITIGGWGTREGAMVTTMTLLGITTASALALSVLFGLCMLLTGLMGGLCFALASRDSKPPSGMTQT